MSDSEIERLFKYMQVEFTKIHENVGMLGERVDGLGLQLNGVESRIDQLDNRITTIDGRMTALEGHMSTFEDQQNAIQDAIGEHFNDQESQLQQQEAWISQLATATNVKLNPQS